MYKVVEMFSGIGSQARALRNLGFNEEVVGTCEWDIHAIIAYDLIHNSPEIPADILLMDKEKLLEKLKLFTFSNSGKEALDFDSLRTYSLDSLRRIYCSITRNKNFVDISTLSGSNMPESIDILTYSFPCQDLSNVGVFHGYNKGIDIDSGSRSSLLWQVGRILEEMRSSGKHLPRFLLMENVPTLLSDRHFPNFSKWINDLKKLGYISKYYQLNASSFGLPQNRPRLLMISVWVGDNLDLAELVLDYFRQKNEDAIVNDYKSSKFYHEYSVQDLLRTDYTNCELFEEACESTPNDTVSRKKIWDENPQIVQEGYILNKDINVVRTITTKQDRNPNSGNLYFESGIKGKGNFRYLTPRECMLFMGFTDDDYQSLKDNNIEFHKGDALFARDKIIRMAGNSIPVKLLEGVFYQIWLIDKLLEDYRRIYGDQPMDKAEREKSIKHIKSFLFSQGIRCRDTSREYPEEADIAYSKYNSLVYIQDCRYHWHSCMSGSLPSINKELWEARFADVRNKDDAIYRKAMDMGWNVIVVWSCALDSENEMQELAKIIVSNKHKGAKVKGVIEIG